MKSLFSLSAAFLLLLGCAASNMRRPPLEPGQVATPSRLLLILVDGLNESRMTEMPQLSELRKRGISFSRWSADQLPLTPLTVSATLATGVYPYRYLTSHHREIATQQTKMASPLSFWKSLKPRLPATIPQNLSGLGAGVTYAIGNGPLMVRPFTKASFEIEPVIRPTTEPIQWLADEVIRRIAQSELEQDTLARSTIPRRNLAKYQAAADWRTIILSLDEVPLAEADNSIGRIMAELDRSGYTRETLVVIGGLPQLHTTKPESAFLEETIPIPALKKTGVVRFMQYNGLLNIWLKSPSPESVGKVLASLRTLEGLSETLILKKTGNEAHYVRAFRQTKTETESPVVKWLDNSAGSGSADIVATVSRPEALGLPTTSQPFSPSVATGTLIFISPNIRLTGQTEGRASLIESPVFHADLSPLISRALQIKNPPEVDGSNSALNGWLRE